MTDPPPDDPASLLMEQLGNKERSLPCLAVIPGNRPSEPILLTDKFTKEELLQILGKLP